MGDIFSRQLQIIALEPRFLFDGAGAATAAKTVADGAHTLTTAEAQAAVTALAAAVPQAVEARPADPAQNDGKKEVAFVDTSLADYQALVDSLRPGVEVELIGGGESGLTQMAQWALTHSGYDAIHLISHGGEGEIRVGTDVLTTETLAETATQAQLTAIGAALNPDGDVLVYGCDAGREADGQTLIQGIARDTGADVAASTDPTGAAALGGDWVLEATTGTIEASALNFPDYNDTLGLSFGTAASYTIGNYPHTIVVADFNHDGKDDLAVTSEGEYTISILLGQGDGTFTPKVNYSVYYTSYGLATSDLNNDNNLDLVATDSGSGHVCVLLGNGDGTFQDKVSYDVRNVPESVAIGDLNGDGKLDIAVANKADAVISMLFGNGDGTFQTKIDYPSVSGSTWITIQDLNNDQKNDIVTANPSGGTISVRLGNGDGTFQNKVDYTTGDGPNSAAVGDVNGDDKLDLVVAAKNSTSVSVLLGNGDGTFQARTTYTAGTPPQWVTLGDFDKDGKVDIAAVSYSSDSVSLLRGNGDGTFRTKIDYAAGDAPEFITVGDVNGDHKLDLVTANHWSGDVSVLLNTSFADVTSINRHSGAPASTNADTLTFDVTFSTLVTGVSTANFSLSGSGVTGTISSVSGSGTTWTVTVTDVSGDGTLGLDLSTVTGIVDASNSALAGTHTSDETYTVDRVRPTVTSIERQTPSTAATNADTLVFRVTFSEAVSNVDASDFTVSGTTGTVTGVASAGGNAYDVTISGGDLADANGTVTLAFGGSQNIADGMGNALTATTPTGTDHSSYTLDNTAPAVSAIVRQTAAGGAAAIVYRVTFSEAPAAAPAIGDFAVFGTTGTVTGVTSAGGNAYDVTISGGDLATVDGTVTLAFSRSQTIADAAGNRLAPTYRPLNVWSFVGTGGASTGMVVDQSMVIAPDGTPYLAYSDVANGGKATVMRFDGTNWVAVGGAASATAATRETLAIASDGTVYLAYADTDKKVTVLKLNGTSWDPVGAPMDGNPLDSEPSLAIAPDDTLYLTYTDTTAKAVVMTFNGTSWVNVGLSVTPPTAAPMGKSFFIASDGTPYLAYSDLANTWAVTVRKFDGTDWVTVGSAGASGQVLTTSVVVASNGTPYVAYVDGTNGNIVAVKRYNGISWETMTAGLPSEVVMNTLSLAIAPDDTLYLTYNTPVAPSQQRVMAFNGTAWTSIGSGENTVLVVPPPRLAVAADGTLYFAYMDMVGTKATVSSLPSGVSLTAIERVGSASIRGVGGLDFTVTFSQGVDGVTADDFTVLKGDGVTGTPTITITAGADGSSTYTVHVAGLAGNGAVELDFTGIGTGIVAHGTTKPIPTAAISSQAYTLDNAGPTIASIERQTPSGAYTRADSVTYRVTFNEAVSNLDAGDFAVTGTTGTVTTVTSAGGNAYDVTVSGGDMADLNGTITLGLAGGQNITDALGNALTVTTVSGTDHSTYTIDNTAPTLVSIVRQTAPGLAASVVFRVTFDGPMAATAATSDFVVTGTTGTVTNVTAAGDNAYDVTISGGDLANVSGTITLGFARGQTITDAAGNPLDPIFSSSYWGLLGPGNFTSQFSYGASMTIDNQGTTYVAFNDGLNAGKATVMKFDGTSWMNVGDAGISAGSVDSISITTDQNGTPYIAFRDNGNDGKATVMRFNGTGWEAVGNPGFTASEIAYSSLVISASGTPYLAFQNSNYMSAGDGKATVMVFNGTTWETVGNASFTAGSATHGSLFVDYYEKPYFAFSDGANGGKASVMTLSGTGGEAQWVAVGDPGFSAGAAQYLSLTFDGLNYFLAYQDNGNDGKATVMKFNGASWEAVGTPGFTAGAATYVSLAIDYQNPNRTLYLGFRDDANGGKATVMSYNGSGWETVGNAGFSATDATFVSFAVYNGTPYLAYAANDDNFRTGSVMRLTPGVTLSSIERASAEKTNGVTGLAYTVTFSGPVDGVTADDFTVIKGEGVTGTPTITIETGTDGSSSYDVTVTGLSGEGTVALNFSGRGTGVVVHGGTAPVPDSGSAGAAYALDTVAPTVTEVTASTSNGTYKAGDTVSIQVTFSEVVTVTGSPRLTLNSATGGRVVNYTSGSGTTTLTFTYTVQAGDLSSDLDFASTAALTLNGGRIKDGAGNNATLTLPTPGEAHSLGANKNIVIDAAAPTASVTRADLSAPTGSDATFTVTYDGTGTEIDGTTIAVGNVTVTGPGSISLTVTGALWDATTNTATYTFTAPGGGWDEGDAGTYTIGIVGNTVKDTAGNAVAAASSAKTFQVVYGPIVTDPHISISGATGTGGVFKIGDTVTATWDDSAAGDNNSRTITGVTFDFSQFGGGAAVTGTSDGQGHWTASHTIVSGSINNVANRNVAVTATDSESLSATTADGTNATVDNSAPAAPPAPALNAASDSGTSNADAITNVTTPTMTGTAEAGSTVRVYEGSTLLATTTADGEGGWSVATSALGAGSHIITAIVTDAAGNTGTVSAGQAIVIDTAAPTASVTRTDLIAPSGTGATFTVTYDGTGTGIDAASIGAGNVTVTGPGNTSLTVTLDGWDAASKTATYRFAAPGGSWDEGDIGSYTIGIVGGSVKDTAGNAVTAASSAKTFQVIYGPIVTDPHISIGGATGTGGVFRIGDTVTATWDNSAAGDNNSRTITGATFDFSQFGGGTVAGTSDGQGHWTARYTIVSGSINNVANRNVAVTATSIDRLSATAADGTNATVDNSAPAAPPAPTLNAASDRGASNADAITNVTTPTITGTAEANSTVRVYDGSTLLATTTADSAGVWSVTPSALGAGSHTITATATDAAGNTGAVSSGRTIVIDTATPTASVTRTDLIAPSGTGATFTVTYDGTGTGIDAASIGAGNVTVTGPGNTSLTVTGASWDAATKTATYTFTAPGGSWDSGDIGTYTIGIVGGSVKDTAGNAVAAASSAKTFQVIYGPIVTDPHISISGATGTGGVFKIGDTVTATWDDSATGDNNSRTITGATFDFSQFGGGTVAGTSDGQGHWTARYTIVSGSINNVANRNVAVTATSIDRLSATAADGTNATVDNSAPAAPPVPALHGASDSGWSNADAITSATTPTITGTAEANSTVRVYAGSTLLATTTTDSAGVWSVATAALGAGSHTITATATDAAGNTGTVSAGQTIIVETIAPVSIAGTLVVPNGSGAGTDIGRVSASDPGGQALRYHLIDDANGRFTIDQNTGVVRLTQALDHGYSAAGLYPITVRVTDAAGLASTATLAVRVTLSSPPPVTVPTPPPVNAPVPQPPPPLITPAISVGTVGATDTGGGVGGRLITTDAMSSSGVDTGAGNGGDRLITASNMSGSAGQSMISTASGSQPGNAGGQSGGSGFSAGLPGGGFGSGFGSGGSGFGSSLSSGVFGSSLTGGTTETGPAGTLPPATGERQGQGPQDGQDTAGEPSPAPAAPDANTPDANTPNATNAPDSPVPDSARTGEAPQPSQQPQTPRPQAALPGPAAWSFTDQLAEAAGRFEHERATLIAAARSAAGLIGRDAA